MGHFTSSEEPSTLALSLKFLKQKWSSNNRHQSKISVERAKTAGIPLSPVSSSDKENENPGSKDENGGDGILKRRRSFFSLRGAQHKCNPDNTQINILHQDLDNHPKGDSTQKDAKEIKTEMVETEEVETEDVKHEEVKSKKSEIEEIPEQDNAQEVKTELSGSSSAENEMSSKLIPTENVFSLYVGDLATTITEDKLSAYFGSCNGLLSVKVPKDINTGVSMGYGYVNFDNKENADIAKEKLNYSELGGSEIRIMPSMRNKTERESIGVNVFLSRLPSDLSTRQLYDHFKSYGSILSCKYIARKGQFFIQFENKDDGYQMIHEVNNTRLFSNDIIYAGIHIPKSNRPPSCRSCADGISMKSDRSENYYSNTKMNPRRNQYAIPKNTEFSIFLKNLPLDIEDPAIKALVEPYGRVQSVLSRQVPRRNGAWALVTLPNMECVNKAIEGLNSLEVGGHRLFVTRAIPREQKEYAKREQEYPQKKVKILVGNLNIAGDRTRLEDICKSFQSFKSIELYGTGNEETSDQKHDYGYVELNNDTESVLLMNRLKLLGWECYKVSIEIPNKERNYEVPHYSYIQPNVAGPDGMISISYLDPTKLFKLAEFKRDVEKDKNQMEAKSHQRDQIRKNMCMDARQRADSVIWELATRMFVNPEPSMNSSDQQAMTAAKVHSMVDHIVKFFWGNRFWDFWQFLQMYQVDSQGRVILLLHPMLKYQLIQSAAYLGVIFIGTQGRV